jgi:GAF domain-containing protein
MQGGTIVGVIQLENRVATGVFTDRQLVVVETICAQALALIATEPDEKYRKKYATVWKN